MKEIINSGAKGGNQQNKDMWENRYKNFGTQIGN